MVVKKIRRSRRRVEIPRLFKNDIRRSYSAMYTNVLNSLDVDVMTSFLGKYFHQDFKSNYTFLQPIQHSHTPQSVETMGFASFLNMWYIGSMSSPDIVYRMCDSQVKVKKECSTVVCTFTVHATKLFVTPAPIELQGSDFDKIVKKKRRIMQLAGRAGVGPNKTNQQLKPSTENVSDTLKMLNTPGAVVGPVSSASSVSSKGGVSTSSSFIDDIQSASMTDFLPRPYKLTIHGTLTMHVDANKRIQSIEYLATPSIGRLDLEETGL